MRRPSHLFIPTYASVLACVVTENKPHFRSSDRLFVIDQSWYVDTREGELGPFPSRTDAARALKQHIGEQQSLKHLQNKRARIVEGRPNIDTTIWDRQVDAI